jgi:hypothetical protein
MSEEKQKLGEALVEILSLAKKYGFNEEDYFSLYDRMLLLGDACAFIEELGLYEELDVRHKRSCKNAAEYIIQRRVEND